MSLDIADIVNVVVQDGEPRVVLGDAATGEGQGANVAMWGTSRIVSVPKSPDANGAAQAIYFHDGQTLRAVATRDNRVSVKAGSLVEGDFAIVSYGNGRFLMKDGDDSITLYTECADGGDSAMITVSGGDNRIFLAIGGSYIEMKKDEGTITMGGVTIHCKNGACTIFGEVFNAACSKLTLGLMPGGIPPVAPAQGVCWGPVGATAIGSTSVAVAP